MERRGSHWSRRAFVVGTSAAGLGLLAGCGRLPGQVEHPARVPRIGYLGSPSPADNTLVEPFRQGLYEHGLVEGQNITIQYRWPEGRVERFPEVAAALVQEQVDVIVTGGIAAATAAKDATNLIPIVMIAVQDPVGFGLIASLGRPGGNITGLTESAPGLPGKLLELLKGVAPATSRVAVLWNPGDAAANPVFKDTTAAAQVLGVELQSRPVRGPEDFESAFEAMMREGAEAVNILGGPLLTQNRARIAQFALENRLPTIYVRREFPEAGGLMAYGVNFAGMARRGAYYVDRILKGAKPADLPVEQPMTFDFVVNMKTARELGITFPNEILLQVTEVIDQ